MHPSAVPLALLLAACIAVSANAQTRSISDIRSVTWYNGYTSMLESGDVDRFKQDLATMEANGFNSVWLVVLWQDIEPVTLPEAQPDEVKLARLDAFMDAAAERGFSVIFPLGYFGKGWAPEGIPEDLIDFWMLNDTLWEAYTGFANRLVQRYGDRENVLWLLYTENMQPGLPVGNDNDVAKESFRAYCRRLDEDIASWNARWKSDYASFDEIGMDDGRFKDGANRWTDHWRWIAEIMRVRFGPLAARMKTTPGWRGRVGYHDGPLITLDWAKGATPIPDDNPYDFLSLTAYMGKDTQEASMEDNRAAHARYKERYPDMPLMIGEVGVPTDVHDEHTQTSYLSEVVRFCADKGMGFNIWMWRDFESADLEQRSFGLLNKDESPKPALDALRTLLTDTAAAE